MISYSYKVINNGNVTLSGPFTVTDNKTSNEACPASPASLTPNTGTLASPSAGSFVVCSSSYTITLADLNNGSVTNVASAHGFFGNTAVDSPTDTATVTATQHPALVVQKSASPGTYSAVGDVISYSYKVINNGNVTLSGPFTVTDNKTSNEACPASPASLTPNTGTLASPSAGSFVVCSSSYTITLADLNNGSVTNVASAHGFFGNTAVDSPTDTATVTATQHPALVVQKSASPGTYSAVGDVISYSYKVINNGNVTLSGPFTVTDNKTSNEACPASPASLTPNTGTLASPSAGSFVVCSSSYTITLADLNNGSVTNVASAHGFFGNTAVDSPTDTATVTATQHPALVVQKSASPGTYSAVGDVISYSYKVINNGNVTLSGPFTVTDNKTSNEACPASPASLTPNTGTLASPSAGSFVVCSSSYTITLADLNNGSVTNVASAHGFFGNTAVDSPTDTATVTASNQTPGLKIEKTANKTTVAPYEPVTYSYKVTNTGGTTLTNILVTDDNGTPMYAGDDFTVGTIPSLDPGASVTLTATVIPVVSTVGTVNGNTVPAGAVIVVTTLGNGDVKVTYLQDFGINDNTYGTGAIGWPSGHKFGDLTGSDKLEFRFFDKNGNVAIDFYVDTISQASSVTVPGTGQVISYPAGYGTLGPFGGDGFMVSGNPNNVVNFSTSITDQPQQRGATCRTRRR